MGKDTRVKMPKAGEKAKWGTPGGSGGTYKPRPMNPDSGQDESGSSNYGSDADKTFDKGRGSGSSGKSKTWAETRKMLKDGTYLE